MRTYKNHEGYADKTAGEAIERVDRQNRRKKEKTPECLTYQLGEVPAFIKAIENL